MKKKIQNLLNLADVKIDGDRDFDIQVHNDGFYRRVVLGGSLALGESYMDGWWDAKALDEFFYKVLDAGLNEKVSGLSALLGKGISKLFNLQKKSRARIVGKKHYDIGNDLFKEMLDERMVYSGGYWKDAQNLDDAQEAKLELICQKTYPKEGMTVLDIGCGYGSFGKYAAEKYKVNVVGITISKEQAKLAEELCKGLPVEIRLQDYRDVKGKFDRVVSVGMFEHVGQKNYREYMQVVYDRLKDGGLFLLQTIGGNKSVTTVEPWFNKYIVPNSMLPSAEQITKSYEGLFVLEDWHNFGHDYAKTIKAWYENFSNNWDKIKDNYDDRFKRMWTYYLLSLVGSFRASQNQLWQIILSKGGVEGEYISVR